MIDTDSEQFDCESCQLADRLCSLDSENAEAWRIFGQLYTRLNLDLKLVPNMFERVVADMDAETVVELVDRLAIIYDVIVPPRMAAPED